MSIFKRLLPWLEARINLAEIFSFITTFGLAYGDIDSRKPFSEVVDDAFKKPRPVYVRWPHALGILAFVLFLFQALTGILLAFYYQPAPDFAYESVLLIIRDTSLGWYLHQMHYWGSSILIGLLVLRLCRFFLHNTYKAPRELVWIFGVVLLFLVMHADLTGKLLPWDQQAYWSAVRTLEILAGVPLIGSLFGLLVGGVELHHITLLRFYILHAILLPLLTLLFFYLHFATVRRVGLSPLPGNRPPAHEPLYPNHLLNLLILLLLVFGAILTLAVLAPVSFTAQADPLDTPAGVFPRWYFLPAYGLQELVGHRAAGLLHLLFLALLLAVPFLDRSADRPMTRRPLALALFALAWIALGLLGYLGYTLRG